MEIQDNDDNISWMLENISKYPTNDCDKDIVNPDQNNNLEKAKENVTTKNDSEKSENEKSVRRSSDKYTLRPRSAKFVVELDCGRRKRRSKGAPKVKHRSAPLSKYRRKTANARERERMADINGGFEHLRNALPNIGENKAKVSKITILRLAMNYISALSQILDNGDPNETLSVNLNPELYSSQDQLSYKLKNDANLQPLQFPSSQPKQSPLLSNISEPKPNLSVFLPPSIGSFMGDSSSGSEFSDSSSSDYSNDLLGNDSLPLEDLDVLNEITMISPSISLPDPFELFFEQNKNFRVTEMSSYGLCNG